EGAPERGALPPDVARQTPPDVARPFQGRGGPTPPDVARPFQGRGREQTIGVALLDLSTGEFSAAEYTGPEGLQALADEIAILKPREIVIPADAEPPPLGLTSTVTPVVGWIFDGESARRTLLDQLRAGGLEGFGHAGKNAAVSAAGALVHYLPTTQKVD